MTAIDVLVDEKLPQRAAILGPQFMERLRNIKSPHVARVNGRGFLCALVLKESGNVTSKRLAALLMERGVLAYAAADRIRLGPPLMISEEDLWKGVNIIEKALIDLVDISGPIYGEHM